MSQKKIIAAERTRYGEVAGTWVRGGLGRQSQIGPLFLPSRHNGALKGDLGHLGDTSPRQKEMNPQKSIFGGRVIQEIEQRKYKATSSSLGGYVASIALLTAASI